MIYSYFLKKGESGIDPVKQDLYSKNILINNLHFLLNFSFYTKIPI